MEQDKHTPGLSIREYVPPHADMVMLWVNDRNDGCLECVPRDIATTIIDAPETAAERDRLKESNAELVESLEEIIAIDDEMRLKDDEGYTVFDFPSQSDRLGVALESARAALAKVGAK